MKVFNNYNGIFLVLVIAATAYIPSNAYAQQSALITSGMGGGASSTARLTAQMSQQQGRVDDIETCGNKGRLFGPSFGGAKDGDNCLTGVTLTSAGNFGIGTTSPSQRLHVDGSAQVTNLRIGEVGHGTSWMGLAHNSIADSSGNYAIVQNASGATLLNAASGQDVHFRIGNSDQMRLTSSGNFGIGTTAPAAKLHVNGTLRSNGALTISGGGAAITGNVTVSNNVTIGGNATADNYYHTSDLRLKSNIRPLEAGESIVARLKPVRFNWKKGDKPSLGFIAQEVEKILPEAIVTNDGGYKAMDYNMIIAPLVATLQAQQAQLAAQQQEIRHQQDAIHKLKSAVTELQNQVT